MARTAEPAGTQEQTGNGRVNMARALADTGTDAIQPAGAAPVGNGGPFVGPYVAAAIGITGTWNSGPSTITYSATELNQNQCYRIRLTQPNGMLFGTDPPTTNFTNVSSRTGSFGPIQSTSPRGTWTLHVDRDSACNNNYNILDVATGTVTVSASATTTSITSAPTITYNANGSVTVTVTSSAGMVTGNVSLTVDSTTTSKALSSGSATFTSADNTALASPSAGNHNLSASYAAQGNFAASGPATGTLQVNKAQVTATAGSGSGTYNGSTQTPSACTVTGTYIGNLSCVNSPASVGPNVGTTTISPVVSGTGLTNFDITSVNGSYTIAKAQVTATAGSGSGTYNGSTQTPSACTVTGTYIGNLSCVNSPASVGPNVGTTTISPVVSGTGLTNFDIASVNGSYTIARATPTITFGPAPTPTYPGPDFTVSASTTNTDSSVLTYSVDSGPCTLVSGATFHATGAGTCVVKASGAQTTNFLAASNTQSVSVILANSPPILSVPNPTGSEGVPLTFQVSATDPDGDTLTYSASNLPTGATFDPATRTFSWKPTSAQGGPNPYLVQFTVSDGPHTDTKVGSITINDTIADRDADGIPDAVDNCPDQYNPDGFDVCHNSQGTGVASDATILPTPPTGPITVTATFAFTRPTGAPPVSIVPPDLFNVICRATSNATGQELEWQNVPESKPINLSNQPDGDLVPLAFGTNVFDTNFDLKNWYPTLAPGSYTVVCTYVNFAHIPAPDSNDPIIWKGTVDAPPQTIFIGLYTVASPFFESPIPNSNYNQGRTVPMKFAPPRDSSGAIVTAATIRLFVQQLVGGVPSGPRIPATSKTEVGNKVPCNTNSCQYNLSTDSLTVGFWELQAQLDDGTIQRITVEIR